MTFDLTTRYMQEAERLRDRAHPVRGPNADYARDAPVPTHSTKRVIVASRVRGSF